MEIFLLCYLAQIPLALYAAFKLPRPPGLGEKTQRLRTLVIVLGVLPCGPLSIFLQVVYLLMYHAAVKVKGVAGARHERAFEEAAGGSRSAGANPFGAGSSTAPAADAPNPFGSSTPAPSDGPAGPNPFSGPREGSADEPGPNSNPFS